MFVADNVIFIEVYDFVQYTALVYTLRYGLFMSTLSKESTFIDYYN